ncbi:conserved hypothetical protein [Clostridium neonatale]|uniref:hypothetical protein n=1 Tax=Clostridium neonatale TaxID=137838 RepID=UPI00291BB617|nr:hypothetical protein [Clostridium neonatale]CAI3223949.1 conserved hypothetical protein [Clostridium neonatale]
MIKIRMEGILEDIKKVTKIFENSIEIKVLSESEPYKNRGSNDYYRVYIDADFKEE